MVASLDESFLQLLVFGRDEAFCFCSCSCFCVCCDDGAHGAMARAGKIQLVTVRHLSSEAHSCFSKPATGTVPYCN